MPQPPYNPTKHFERWVLDKLMGLDSEALFLEGYHAMMNAWHSAQMNVRLRVLVLIEQEMPRET